MWCKYVSQFGLSSTHCFLCGGLPIVQRKSRHSTVYCGGPHECERPLRALVLRIEGTERSILHLVRLKQVSQQRGSSDYSGCSDLKTRDTGGAMPGCLSTIAHAQPELLDYLDHLAHNRIFRISLCLLLRTQFALDRPAFCVHPSPQQLMQKILQFSSNVIIVPCDGFNRFSSSWRSWTPSAATIG